MKYVDNEKLYEALVERRAAVLKAKAEGLPPPRISEYIGKCLFDIGTHLYYKPGFINLRLYKEEMIADAIENCIRSVDKFDPALSTHPFSYFTQISYYAYLRRIGKERRYFMTKQRLLLESPEDGIETQDQDAEEGYTEDYINRARALQQITDYDKSLEKAPKKPREPTPPGPLEMMMDPDV